MRSTDSVLDVLAEDGEVIAVVELVLVVILRGGHSIDGSRVCWLGWVLGGVRGARENPRLRGESPSTVAQGSAAGRTAFVVVVRRGLAARRVAHPTAKRSLPSGGGIMRHPFEDSLADAPLEGSAGVSFSVGVLSMSWVDCYLDYGELFGVPVSGLAVLRGRMKRDGRGESVAFFGGVVDLEVVVSGDAGLVYYGASDGVGEDAGEGFHGGVLEARICRRRCRRRAWRWCWGGAWDHPWRRRGRSRGGSFLRYG